MSGLTFKEDGWLRVLDHTGNGVGPTKQDGAPILLSDLRLAHIQSSTE